MAMETSSGDFQPAVISVRDQLDEEISYNKLPIRKKSQPAE
ncbi:hypothetical protein BIW11_04011 [Tropilaelaps mercedesae]|uniref:Uncharacterized protein n=1 Tax=Tropilaelaps mercedesae TaxID=418985 RepID=A0A1V9XCG4_9ACAR|nr:hypothetical protein BIW11_04011 [Tropilaelaps mercedesae]